MTAVEVLKQYFGYDSFREGQIEIIDALTDARDVLAVMPTGAGKSVCYQIPAMLLPGVTLVVSPLISLMRDQVQALSANGIPAAYINSSLTETQWQKVMINARSGEYRIIYIAPERLLAPSMVELSRSLNISLIAVDEAHCISQWGQDFRPSYLDIPKFLSKLPTRPVLSAFTATATPRVRTDILATLGLLSPLTTITGFDRPNLYFEVKRPKDKYAALTQYLDDNETGGIVYCSTRKEVEYVAQRLKADGYSAVRYHAGLSDKERNQSQDDYLHDRVKIIVATNAFGMGIDKSNVRFVIHYNMTQNVESYYQEAGRAGRDGLPASCILYYARKDINTALFLINQSKNPDEIARNKQLLNQMERYCETDGCLRRYILHYFGEKITEDCGNCGNCIGDLNEIDVTIDAQKILSHILRLNNAGKRFMFTHTADILLGKSEDFTELSTFGIMKGVPRRYIRQLISRLTMLGYLYDDDYLSVTPKANEVLFDGVHVTIRGDKTDAKVRRCKDKRLCESVKYAVSEELFSKLKTLRLEIAKEESVPAFVIFSDATLVDMCIKYPRDENELLSVSGVGQIKMSRYGKRFLDVLHTVNNNPEEVKQRPELTPELFQSQVEIEKNPISVSRVADNVSSVLIRYGKPKISGAALNRLLIDCGYLNVVGDAKLPTEIGKLNGIITVERTSDRGMTYTQCLFNDESQRNCVELVLLKVLNFVK